MNSIAALTRSSIALPDDAPISLEAVEDTLDVLISLIDDALALMEDQS
jgi:hypothetical protein